MLVTERMQALGDHARSSRQPPLKERKYAKADASAATDDVVVKKILDITAAPDSAAPPITADGATPQAAETTSAQPPAHEDGGDSEAEALAARDDADLVAAKRAIVHEWENWSALHSDELSDTKVTHYFLRHLQNRKPQLLSFASKDDERSAIVQQWISGLSGPFTRERQSNN
jgi:hypothetical protein